MRKINIIILLVLCLTLLLLTCYIVNAVISETTSGNLENQENTEEPIIVDTEESGTAYPQKWSGLGMGLFSTYNTSEFDGYVDILLVNGFTELRIDIPDYQDTIWLEQSKAAVIRAIAKGIKVIWGVSSNKKNNIAYTITAANWPTYRQAILDNALWAQNNGVYEFQLGNEEETHNDDKTLTNAQLITNLKSVATDVQAIFTNGKISYTCSDNYISNWIIVGKGDIDILAANIYMQGTGRVLDWRGKIDDLVAAFGTDGTYLTEFAPDYTSLDHYSKNEAVQATAVTEMIEYIKTSGITRAFYFMWKSDELGVVKADGTYRLLWSQALINTGPVKSTTVPKTATTISLHDTIVLIPRITR